jgi:hypothetical protein
MGSGLGSSEKVWQRWYITTNLGSNTHMHGINKRNLPVYSFETSKDAMFFLLSVMFFLQQNWRTRG